MKYQILPIIEEFEKICRLNKHKIPSFYLNNYFSELVENLNKNIHSLDSACEDIYIQNLKNLLIIMALIPIELINQYLKKLIVIKNLMYLKKQNTVKKRVVAAEVIATMKKN